MKKFGGRAASLVPELDPRREYDDDEGEWDSGMTGAKGDRDEGAPCCASLQQYTDRTELCTRQLTKHLWRHAVSVKLPAAGWNAMIPPGALILARPHN